jgi:alkylhydroperoxidase family enzyme
LLGDAALVESVMTDLESSGFDERHKALFRFVDTVNRSSPTIGDADFQAVRAAGWTDEELYFAITVCALFNFYNRWIDAAGVQAMSDEAHKRYGARTAEHGYIRK